MTAERHATITTDGTSILARITPPFKPGSRLAHEIPGCRADWDKSVTPHVFLGWRYPLDMVTCRQFRRVFGPDLTVLPPLIEWSKAQVATERTMEEFREGVMANVDMSRVKDEAPALYDAVMSRPYQAAGVGFLLAGRTTILADDPGLGKTLQALAAVIQSDARTVLVACRRTATRTVWEREILRWTLGVEPFVAQGTRDQREKVFRDFAEYDLEAWGEGARKVLIINIEMIRARREEWCPATRGKCAYPASSRPADHPQHQYRANPDWPFLFDQEWDAIIIDESHNLLASQANIQSKHITLQRFGAMKLRLRDGGLKIAMSGTPFRSKPEKGWGTLNWLQPKNKQFTSFWRWAETYFNVDDGGYRGAKRIGGGAKVIEPKDPDAWDAMLRPWYLKRTKHEAAPELPPIVFAGTPSADNPEGPCYVRLEMTDVNGSPSKQAKAYRQMVREAEANLDGGRITATGTLAEITRLRQFANAYASRGEGRAVLPELPSNKIEWLLDFLQEREGTGVKVVVASSFTEMVELTADVIRKELGLEVLTLTGATSDRDRADLVARFQDMNDPLRVVVINREAGGESITLDAADDMVVLDQPWISDKDEQLNARIHRVSRVHQVTVYRLVSVGTVDEWMADMTEEQRDVLATLNPKTQAEKVLAALAGMPDLIGGK